MLQQARHTHKKLKPRQKKNKKFDAILQSDEELYRLSYKVWAREIERNRKWSLRWNDDFNYTTNFHIFPYVQHLFARFVQAEKWIVGVSKRTYVFKQCKYLDLSKAHFYTNKTAANGRNFWKSAFLSNLSSVSSSFINANRHKVK